MEGISFQVFPEERSKRIDRFIAEKTGITRSQVRLLIENGRVLVNGMAVKAGYRVKPSDEIAVRQAPAPEPQTALVPEDIPINILYRDGHLAVVDKPPGMVVYPAPGHAGGTLMNALKFHIEKLAGVGGPLRPGVVHRLDKETSGVMVVALSDAAYYGLVEQFKERGVKKRYLALLYGKLKGESGRISSKIGRSGTDRKKMSTRAGRGKEALTSWEAVERLSDATLVSVRIETGRTHQIRVHFSSIGHPVLGDRTYGRKISIASQSFRRQMLHAEALGFTHPITGEHMEFTAPLPEDMKRAIEIMRGA